MIVEIVYKLSIRIDIDSVLHNNRRRLAWFIFIEDTLALDNVLFVPEMLSGQLTQFSRPFLLVALTYMAVESRRRRSDG